MNGIENEGQCNMRDDFDMLSVRCDMRNDIVVYLGLSFLGYPSFLNIHVFAIPRLRSCVHLDFWVFGLLFRGYFVFYL